MGEQSIRLGQFFHLSAVTLTESHLHKRLDLSTSHRRTVDTPWCVRHVHGLHLFLHNTMGRQGGLADSKEGISHDSEEAANCGLLHFQVAHIAFQPGLQCNMPVAVLDTHDAYSSLGGLTQKLGQARWPNRGPSKTIVRETPAASQYRN